VQQAYPELRIQGPQWEWDAERDWNAPLSADLEEWVATVHHAAFNISIPSTVTWEFLALGRPVLNVCLDAGSSAAEGKSNRRYWDAPFYREIRESPGIYSVFSREQLEAESERLLASWHNSSGGSPPDIRSSPVETAIGLIDGLLHARSQRQRAQDLSRSC
jgi:hypothetical protein